MHILESQTDIKEETSSWIISDGLLFDWIASPEWVAVFRFGLDLFIEMDVFTFGAGLMRRRRAHRCSADVSANSNSMATRECSHTKGMKGIQSAPPILSQHITTQWSRPLNHSLYWITEKIQQQKKTNAGLLSDQIQSVSIITNLLK